MRSNLARRAIARRALVVVGAAVLTIPFVASSAFSASSSRSTIAGSVPGWTSAAHATGTASASKVISFNVVLRLRNPAGAEKLAADVANPKSADYGHYQTASQFNAQFAPTTKQVDAVRSFLTGSGIKVGTVAQGNRWISASGSVRQINAAFGTAMKTYTYRGKTLTGPSRALNVPASVGGIVAAVVGISSEAQLRRPDNMTTSANGQVDGVAGPNDAVPPRAACSMYWDQNEQVSPPAYGKTSFPTNNCGYSPAQIRGAYGVQSSVSHGTNGHGVTVAIIDAYASPTMLSDSNQYSTVQGEPQFAAGQYTETTFQPFDDQAECGGELGWNSEETLDVEAVHGVAPGANVHFIGAMNCDTGIDDAVNYVIQNNVANIVSNSYGFAGEDGLGDEVATEHALFVQAAAEGIGFYYSSGDRGDNVSSGAPHPEPDYPASDPLVTGVGGTDLAVTSSNGYQFETSWGDDLDSVNFATSPNSLSQPLPGSFLFGGGGGVSALFAEPLYQKLAVPNSLAKLNGGAAMRVVPDVAALGDPETGFAIGISDGSPFAIGTIGGTSLACPVIAGIQALASQGRRVPIGFANPLLYTLNLSGAVFHDVKAPASPVAMMTQSGRSLLTLGQDSSLTSTKGYDDTTGLGTPNGLVFLLAERLL